MKTPELIAQSNVQGEITLHNMEWFPLHDAFIVVGLYGTLAPLLVPSRLRNWHPEIVDAFVSDVSLFLYFLPVAMLYIYYDYLSGTLVAILGDSFAWGKGRFIHGADQEAVELLLSFGFLLFVLINRWRLSGTTHERTSIGGDR